MRTAFIGMGGNLPSHVGPPEATLTAAAERLTSLGKLTHCSSLYRTDPVGFADQPRFVNAVVAIETPLEPRALLTGLLAIEQEFGRDRGGGVRNGPRTLDLDLLWMEGVQLSEPGLEIPHPRLLSRAFVLVPLAEVASQMPEATLAPTVKQWLQQLPRGTESDPHEVVRMDWSGWRAGARAGRDGPHARGRAGGNDPGG